MYMVIHFSAPDIKWFYKVMSVVYTELMEVRDCQMSLSLEILFNFTNVIF